jgi:hypothetical protein
VVVKSRLLIVDVRMLPKLISVLASQKLVIHLQNSKILNRLTSSGRNIGLCSTRSSNQRGVIEGDTSN